jgi:hypothetical protein
MKCTYNSTDQHGFQALERISGSSELAHRSVTASKRADSKAFVWFVRVHLCPPVIQMICERLKHRSALLKLVFLLFCCALAGCVSKSTAAARARAAFMAGQQQQLQQQTSMMARQNQIRGPTVTVLGPVRNSLVPWTADLTLAKAVLAAEYYGPRDPSAIIIQRGGKEFTYDPETLLNGQDIPIDPNDVIEISP